MTIQAQTGASKSSVLTEDVHGEAAKKFHATKEFMINYNFRLLMSGQTISDLGDAIYAPTMLVWVFTFTHSTMALSGVLIAQILPRFLLGPIAGVFVDRWNRRYTMLITSVFLTLVALLPLFAPELLRLPAIYIATFLISVGAIFFFPAASGLRQVIISQEQQAQAAAISGATTALTITLGPAIATPLYFALGPIIAVSLNALSFFVLVVCLLFMRLSPTQLQAPIQQTDKHTHQGLQAVLYELVSGFRYILHSRTLLALVNLVFIAALGSGAVNTLHVMFISQNLHVNAAYYGTLMTIGGCGLLLGSLLAKFIAKKATSKQLLIAGVLFEGLGAILYSQQTQYPLALVVYFLMYLPQGLTLVGFTPLIFSVTPNTIIGRVQAVIDASYAGINFLSALVVGMLGLMVPVSIIFLANGILVFLSAIFGWFMIPSGEEPSTEVLQSIS